jgi:hypothetical protein
MFVYLIKLEYKMANVETLLYDLKQLSSTNCQNKYETHYM